MIIDLLKQHNVVKEDRATATPLTGGVSCEIFLIEDGDTKYVAKRALSKLKVEQDWFADTSRNIYEQRYLKYVGEQFPEWVPDILQSFEEENLFLMEFFPSRFKDWKKYLMNGEIDPQVATLLGEALGSIHKASWGDDQAEKWFDSDSNFHELRLSPYFEFLSLVQPKYSEQISALNEKIKSQKRCLVHGDFSPKNILVSGSEIKIVDCEVAWYGDPVFDVGFMLHHLFLKAIHFNNTQFVDMADRFVQGYKSALGEACWTQIEESHLVEVTLFLMLARVDGKSPAEYLTDREKIEIRALVATLLNNQTSRFEQLIEGIKNHDY
jgi:5-methylthioribose kinase